MFPHASTQEPPPSKGGCYSDSHILEPRPHYVPFVVGVFQTQVRFPHKVDRAVTSLLINDVCLPFQLFVWAVGLAPFEKGLILLLLSYDIGLSVFIWLGGIHYVCQM